MISVLFLNQLVPHNELSNLNRISCGSFSKVIRYYPHVQRVGIGEIPPDPAHKYFIFATYIDRHGIFQTGNIIFNNYSISLVQYFPDTIDINNPRNIVQRILKDGDYFWVDVDLGLLLFNKETGHFKSFDKDSTNPSKGIYGEWSRHIFIDDEGILWVVSYEPGKAYALSKLNKE